MDYIELLKTHWLFLVINVAIFIAVVFMAWAAVRIGYSRDVKLLRAEYERAEEAKLDAKASEITNICEQGRQLVALIVDYKRQNLTSLLAQHYNLLSHLIAQQLCPTLDSYANQFLATQPKLSAASLKQHQQQFGKFLQDGQLLYKALNAPILLSLLNIEPQEENLHSNNIKQLLSSLAQKQA